MFDPYQIGISKINHNKKNLQKNNFQKIIISNIEICFPYSPHESQIFFMKKIIYNLNQKFLLQSNYKGLCALESPPGTKKILCLLSACLAWMNDMKKTNTYKGKIIFVVKNYNKISKIINKLNNIYYKPKVVVLFSPYESCLNDEINKYINNDIIFLNCRNIRENCEFYHNMKKNKNLGKNNEYFDIEDFQGFICDNRICPFLYEKNKMIYSDIIFITYENFFDKNIKNIYGYEINNNIIIFDEGENLDKICENFQSISISVSDLEEIKKIILDFIGNKYMETMLKNREYNININDVKSEIFSIDRIINNMMINKDKINEGEVFPNKGYLLKNKEFLSLFLTKNNNNMDDMQFITLDNIKKHILLLINIEKLINLFFSKNTKILLLSSILEKIYNFYINQSENLIDSFSFFLFFEKKEQNKLNIKLNIYCFNPSISFKDFVINERPFSVFLLSNYFGPYDLLNNEFKTKFDVELKNKCIYKEDNYQLNIIQSTLFNEEKIEFILDEINNDNITIKLALGYTLLSLCYSNPHGSILVFFPSMTYLYQCNLIWKENNIINDISQLKKIIYFLEKELYNNDNEINSRNNIYFLEFDINNSINEMKELKDKNISMVIILGLPQEKQYNFSDKIQLKMNYIDSKKNKILNNKKNVNYYDEFNIDDISGEKWFERNIMIPINIFLSKALKLMQGLGSIICIDNRYINALNNDCFCWFLKNKAEIVNIQNKYYFDDLLSFYQRIENKRKLLTNEEIYHKEKIIVNKSNNNNLEESENFFIYKNNKTRLFCVENKEKINLNDINNIEDNYFNISNKETEPKKKYNIINNDINIELLKKKQNRLNEEENKKINNNKRKKEINNDNINNNIVNNIYNEYEQIERDNENNELDNNDEYELNMELLKQLNENNFTEESSDIFECPICFKLSNNNPDLIYSRAKCKHVLCNECWCGWFSEKFECPICKGKARPKTLKKIIFIK